MVYFTHFRRTKKKEADLYMYIKKEILIGPFCNQHHLIYKKTKKQKAQQKTMSCLHDI